MSNIVPNGKRIDFSGLVAPGEYNELESIREQMLRQVTALPRRGTPAAELTERDKLALALAAGAPWASEMNGTRLTFRTTVPVGVADRGDGGYIVAIGQPRAR